MNLHVCAILNCNMQSRATEQGRNARGSVSGHSQNLAASFRTLPFWVMALPFHCHSLSFKNLGRSHLSFGIGKVCFGAGQFEPHVSLNVILRNSKNLHIEQTQIVPALTCPSQVWDVVRSLSVPFGS